MATQRYKCKNFAKCELARKRQAIEFIDGKRQTECPLNDPNCQRALQPIGGAGSGGGGKKAPLILAVITLLLVGGGTWWALRNDAPKPTAEALLREVWPWLKPDPEPARDAR